MLVTEPHGRVVACNEAFCHTFQTTNEVVTRGAAALNLLHAPSSEEFHATLRCAAGPQGGGGRASICICATDRHLPPTSSIASLTGHRGHDVAIGEPSKPRFGESMDVQRTLVVPTQHGSYMEAPVRGPRSPPRRGGGKTLGARSLPHRLGNWHPSPQVTMRLFVIPAAGSSARSEEERKMRAAGVANAPEAVPTNVHIACVLYGAADPTAWKGGSAAPAQPTEAEVAPGTESLSAAEQAPVPAPASTASYTAAAAPVTSSAPQGPPLPAGYYPGFGVSEAGMYGTSPSAVAFHHAGLAARGGHPPYGAEYPVPGAQAPRPPAPAPYPFAMGMGQAPQVSRSMPGWPGQGALPVGHQPYLQHQPQPQPQAHPQLEGALDGEPPRRDAGPPPPTAMHA